MLLLFIGGKTQNNNNKNIKLTDYQIPDNHYQIKWKKNIKINPAQARLIM